MMRNRATEQTADAGRTVTTEFDRRALLRRGTALGVGLVGTGTLVRFGPAAAQDATPAGSPAAASVNPEIVAAANAFIESLSVAERETALFDFSDNEQKQNWSNFPDGAYDRAGLVWGDLGDAPREAWLEVMQVTLSAEGYDRVLGIWYGDDALGGDDDGGTPAGGFAGDDDDDDDGGPDGSPPAGGPGGGGGANFGSQFYYLSILGTPSETDPWMWQFGGHHLAVNATIVGPDLVLTPSFIGVEPTSYTDADGNTVTPLADIETDAFALVDSLDDAQRQAAVLGDEPINLVLGPQQDGRSIQPEGLPGAEMTADQQATLLQLIGRYTGLGNDAAAVARLAELEAALDETYLAWYGPTTPGNAAYFRVTGPNVVIEYSPQGDRGQMAVAADTHYHVHGIYRDPTNDYGARLTGITIES